MRIAVLTMAAIMVASCGRVAFAQTAQFPAALATDANLKVAVNGVNTLLTATITSATLTTSVSSCAGIVPNVLITIDTEIIPVSGCAGTVIAFNSRGFDGSTAAAHNSGASIGAFVDAWYLNAMRVETEAIESALGINLANVVLSSAIISPSHGGTGVNNGSKSLTLGGNTMFTGAFNPTFAIPSSSTWTFPAAGTLIGSADTGTVTNAMLAGSISPSQITGTAVTQADTATVTNTMLAGSIAAAKLIGTDIATVGTVTAGTWHGTPIGNAYLAAPITVTSCGSSASCSGSSVKTTGQFVTGTVTFSSATSATITGMPAFTATQSFTCYASDPSHAAYVQTTQNQSTTSFIITSGTSNSDTWNWGCFGS